MDSLVHFRTARTAEIAYHQHLYSTADIGTKGTWLANPPKEVTSSIPNLPQKGKVLDLGCGIGRNTIPIAKARPHVAVVAVDMLPIAIDKLTKYSYNLDNITTVVADVENFRIKVGEYDAIYSISCIEHVLSEEVFIKMIKKIIMGTKKGGFNLFMINSDISETDVKTKKSYIPKVELNLQSSFVSDTLNNLYSTWQINYLKLKKWNVIETSTDRKINFISTCVVFEAVNKLK